MAQAHELLTAVAVIGLSGVFPKSHDIEAWWRNLRDGVDLGSSFTDEELVAAGERPEFFRDPRYVRRSAVLDDEALFDASFFGFSPREAEMTDPNHRFFLEAAYHALENAGYLGEQYRGRIGVFAGQSSNSYFRELLRERLTDATNVDR